MHAYVDEEGRLVLPAEIAARYGLEPGAEARLDEETGALRLARPVTHLAKLYIEPTSHCNLNCRTCVRNVWDEAPGYMADATFERVMEALGRFRPPPMVFFGGFGEPLAHPRIVDMVARAKSLGGRVELITNGTLLGEQMSRGLIAAGLDALWVSLDGPEPASYGEVRPGASLRAVLSNITAFKNSRPPAHRPRPEIGVAFVAMKSNLAGLSDLLQLARRLGATRLMVTNLVPHTSKMRDEVLYGEALREIAYQRSAWVPHASLPKMDVLGGAKETLFTTMRHGWNTSVAGNNWGSANDRCPFIEAGAAAVGWDGSFSPCLPLLHSFDTYLQGRPRFSRRFIVGNAAERGLGELWQDTAHQAFRRRVQDFVFSPCSYCGGCDLARRNEEDCMGNTFPTCGGCLWAQGIVQCP